MYTESASHRGTSDIGRVALALSRLPEATVQERCKLVSYTHPPISLGAILPEIDLSAPTMQKMVHAVSALINAVNCALSGESDHAREYLGDAFRSLDHEPTASAAGQAGPGESSIARCRGGLAPWQIRRVSTHIEEHLSESIQCDDLARLVRLSLSHFMRAFRDSFGCPPHTYLMKRRTERAQGLMLSTDTALGQIALDCGLSDQSHLSRLFHKFVGDSPAAWRRARQCRYSANQPYDRAKPPPCARRPTVLNTASATTTNSHRYDHQHSRTTMGHRTSSSGHSGS